MFQYYNTNIKFVETVYYISILLLIIYIPIYISIYRWDSTLAMELEVSSIIPTRKGRPSEI